MTQKQKQKTTRQVLPVVSPRVSKHIKQRLRQLGWSGADFVKEMHRVYGAPKKGAKNADKDSGGARNHLYKIIAGTTTAGEGENYLLPKICKLLDLDFDQVLKLLHADKIEKKGWDSSTPHTTAALKEISVLWDSLSKADKSMILDLARIRAQGTE